MDINECPHIPRWPHVQYTYHQLNNARSALAEVQTVNVHRYDKQQFVKHLSLIIKGHVSILS